MEGGDIATERFIVLFFVFIYYGMFADFFRLHLYFISCLIFVIDIIYITFLQFAIKLLKIIRIQI